MEQRVGVLLPRRGEQRLALGLVVPVDDGDAGATTVRRAEPDDALGETRIVGISQIGGAVGVAAQFVEQRQRGLGEALVYRRVQVLGRGARQHDDVAGRLHRTRVAAVRRRRTRRRRRRRRRWRLAVVVLEYLLDAGKFGALTVVGAAHQEALDSRALLSDGGRPVVVLVFRRRRRSERRERRQRLVRRQVAVRARRSVTVAVRRANVAACAARVWRDRHVRRHFAVVANHRLRRHALLGVVRLRDDAVVAHGRVRRHVTLTLSGGDRLTAGRRAVVVARACRRRHRSRYAARASGVGATSG